MMIKQCKKKKKVKINILVCVSQEAEKDLRPVRKVKGLRHKLNGQKELMCDNIQ